MTKNLAFIVGITDYVDSTMRLTACERDVALMETVLRSGGRFDEVITIRSQDAQALKGEIAATIGRFKHEDVDDLLFYFTGHGDFVDDDFNYLLRDYDKTQIAKTTLSNSELDGMLKSLDPGLLVKVVDACHSGMPYIKGGGDLSEYINNSSKDLFAKCYFLFSSENDQKSYAEDHGSDFTVAFARSIVESVSDTVRYKDIIDSLSDSFSKRRRQKPLFITQASFTEVFGNYTAEKRQRIGESIMENEPNQVEQVASENEAIQAALPDLAHANPPSLLSQIQNSARDYISLSQARELISGLKVTIDSSSTNGEVDDFYSIRKEFKSDYSNVPNPALLGEWLSSNKAGEYFAAPTHTMETYEVESNWTTVFALSGHEGKKITKTRKVISGIDTDLSAMAFISCSLVLQPKYPNLLQYGGWLTYVISKTTIQVFYCFVEYTEVSWGEYKVSSTTKWERKEFKLADADSINAIVKSFFASLSDWVIGCVTTRATKLLPTSSEND